MLLSVGLQKRMLAGSGLVVLILGAFSFYSCATDSTSNKSSSSFGDDDGGGGGGGDGGSDDDLSVSGNFDVMTVSLSNNSLTSKAIDKGKAEGMVRDLQGSLRKPDFKDRKELLALLSVQAMGGGNLNDAISTARELVNVEMARDIKRDLPEIALVSIVFAAIKARNFALAEHFLLNLTESKNKKVKAAARTAEGLIALIDDKVPEAVQYWNLALKEIPNYPPALYNLGYTALKYGDYVTAQKALTPFEGDWFAQTGIMIAERASGDGARVAALCDRILDRRKDYKPAMFSCALNKFQAGNKPDEAIEALQQVTKAQGNIPAIDEKAFRVIAEIEQYKRDQKEKELLEKAREREEKARAKQKPQGQASDGEGQPQEAPQQ